jgi:nitroreductase
MHHFGEGLVRSVDNFGYTGDKPTHPELLDHLANRFMQNGFSTKALHRLLVTSQAYRQSALHPEAARYEASDAGNHLLWRANRRRLDAEAVRDAMLAASGQLDVSKVGGPSFIPEISPEALEGWSKKGSEYKASPPEQQRRRTLYAYVKRGLLDPTQTVFDAPDSTLPCGKRDSTTVPTQALALLNNPLAKKLAEALAAKAGHAEDAGQFVVQAWRMALARDPSPEEQRAALEHLRQQAGVLGSEAKARQSLALVLLNTNEFVFAD